MWEWLYISKDCDPKRTSSEPIPSPKSVRKAISGVISHVRITYQNDNLNTKCRQGMLALPNLDIS